MVFLERESAELVIEQLYPSPTTGLATVRFLSPTETDVHLQVYDMTGQLVVDQTLGAQPGLNQAEINLTTMPACLFTILLAADQGDRTTPKRLVKD